MSPSPLPISVEHCAAWYERRQMKKIYSPLLEGLLALYLGFEWIQVTLATYFFVIIKLTVGLTSEVET